MQITRKFHADFHAECVAESLRDPCGIFSSRFNKAWFKLIFPAPAGGGASSDFVWKLARSYSYHESCFVAWDFSSRISWKMFAISNVDGLWQLIPLWTWISRIPELTKNKGKHMLSSFSVPVLPVTWFDMDSLPRVHSAKTPRWRNLRRVGHNPTPFFQFLPWSLAPPRRPHAAKF